MHPDNNGPSIFSETPKTAKQLEGKFVISFLNFEKGDKHHVLDCLDKDRTLDKIAYIINNKDLNPYCIKVNSKLIITVSGINSSSESSNTIEVNVTVKSVTHG